MKLEYSTSEQRSQIKRLFFFLSISWTVLFLMATGYHVYSVFNKKKDLAINEATIAFNKDVIYRKWNALHGGVYAKVDEKTKPNPYLHVKERDIITPSGTRLTLINPAYMTRQVQALERKEKGMPLTHITSLRPLSPINKPFQWEVEALRSFEKGSKQYAKIVDIEGKEVLRFMRPFYVIKPCLKCHGQQGYKIGDIRGGISVQIPLDRLAGITNLSVIKVIFINSLLWLLGILGIGFVLTKLEGELEKRAKAEARLKAFMKSVDNLKDGLIMANPKDLKIFFVNKGALRLFGINDKKKLYGKHFFDVLGLKRKEFCENIDCLLDDGKPLLFDTTLNVNGSEKPIEISIQYVRPKNYHERLVILIKDITFRKEAEEEKKRLQAELLHSQKLESVGRLAAGLAHEINTPAQYIVTNINFVKDAVFDLLEIAKRCDDLKKRFLKGENIDQEIKEISELIEDCDLEFLEEEIPDAFSQTEEGLERITSIIKALKELAGHESTSKQPANINQIIKTAATISQNEYRFIAEIILDLDENIPLIQLSSAELGQAILNLITNAARAIEKKIGKSPGKDKGTITITTRDKGDFIEIKVSDTGIGIPEDIREKIFDPFFTTEEVGKGMGQGLTITYNVITQKLGGTLKFDTQENQGTTFIIKIPKGK